MGNNSNKDNNRKIYFKEDFKSDSNKSTDMKEKVK